MDSEDVSPARGDWEGLANLFETPIRDVINDPLKLLRDRIDDPQGEFNAPLGRKYLPHVEIPPPVVIRTADSPVALRYQAEFKRLELELGLGLAELQANEEGTDHVNILQQNISGPGMDAKYTATSAPFFVPLPAGTLDVAATAPIEIPIPKLLDSTLEPARSQDGVAAEKVLNEDSSSSGSSQQ